MRPREWVRRRPDLVLALALLILPFLVLGRALLPGKVLSPADNVVMFTPWAALAPGVTPANPLLFDITFLSQPATIYAAEEMGAARASRLRGESSLATRTYVHRGPRELAGMCGS